MNLEGGNKNIPLEYIESQYNNMPQIFGPEQNQTNKVWIDMNNSNSKSKYPIYILSKGRWKQSYTAYLMMILKLDFFLVIEKEEVSEYKKYVPEKYFLILPKSKQGLLWVRNYVWEHSIKLGFKRHWQFDDDIHTFTRKYNGLRRNCWSSAPLIAFEKWMDKYDNIAVYGFNYQSFAPPSIKKPFYLNTRVYSMLCIKNDLPFRFESKYNEDTDFSLTALKNGYNTVLLNSFLISIETSATQPGGNSHINKDKRKIFVQELIKRHPDIVKESFRFNKIQHIVDYTSFNQLMKKRKNVKIKKGFNNLNLILYDRNKYNNEYKNPFINKIKESLN